MASIIWMAITTAPATAGIRCGNDLIAIDDTSFEVRMKLEKCGTVFDKEVIRKDTVKNKDDKTSKTSTEERVIEHWYVRVKERGQWYCYPLTFEAGVLTDIGGWGRCE